MLRGNLVGGVIEVDEVATADVHSADAEASCSGVYQVEIYQTFESDLEGSSIVVAQSFWPHRRIKVWRRESEVEENGRPEEEGGPWGQVIDDAVGGLGFELYRRQIWYCHS